MIRNMRRIFSLRCSPSVTSSPRERAQASSSAVLAFTNAAGRSCVIQRAISRSASLAEGANAGAALASAAAREASVARASPSESKPPLAVAAAAAAGGSAEVAAGGTAARAPLLAAGASRRERLRGVCEQTCPGRIHTKGQAVLECRPEDAHESLLHESLLLPEPLRLSECAPPGRAHRRACRPLVPLTPRWKEPTAGCGAMLSASTQGITGGLASRAVGMPTIMPARQTRLASQAHVGARTGHPRRRA